VAGNDSPRLTDTIANGIEVISDVAPTGEIRHTNQISKMQAKKTTAGCTSASIDIECIQSTILLSESERRELHRWQGENHSSDTSELLAEMWNYLGLVRCHQQHNYQVAMHCHQRSLHCYRIIYHVTDIDNTSTLGVLSHRQRLRLATIFSDIALCYERVNQCSEAIVHYQEALHILTSTRCNDDNEQRLQNCDAGCVTLPIQREIPLFPGSSFLYNNIRRSLARLDRV
jgi:hypothetical protein